MAGTDWSLAEVEATVTDYFSMLKAELSAQPYNKAERRRLLQALLNERSKSAIEFKRQNISAILIEQGLPYIDGYKPKHNYQALLFDVVVDQLRTENALLELVKAHVERPAPFKSSADYLSCLEAPPDLRPLKTLSVNDPTPHYGLRRKPIKIDYLAREARNQSLGAAGEDFVLRFEKARLISAGKENLADRIKHVSLLDGDGEGFDIRSFEENGSDRLIEVKTTRYGKETPFYLTDNELQTSLENHKQYHLYRLFTFERDPRLFYIQGALSQVCHLNPATYKASFAC